MHHSRPRGGRDPRRPGGGCTARHRVQRPTARHIVNASATWSDPQDDPINIDWARRTCTALGRVGTDSGYLNFLGDEQDRARAVFAGPSYSSIPPA